MNATDVPAIRIEPGSRPADAAPAGRPGTLLRLSAGIDAFTDRVGRLVAWLVLPMVFALSWEVIARYGFNAPTLWAYDMTFMLYGTLFMLGAAYALRHKQHIRTDSLYGGWSARTQGRVDLACYLLMFYPFVAVLLFVGWGYFWKSFTTGERFVSSPWMPIAWPFKGVIPLTGLLLALQGVSETIKSWHAATTGRWPADPGLDAAGEQPAVQGVAGGAA